MGSFGAPELLIVVGVIVLLFGAKKLPEIARSMGRARGEFKRGLDEGDATAGTPGEDKPAEAKLDETKR